MSKLMEYFNAVDKSAVARAAHRTAPVASMLAFGLSTEEQNAILSNDRGSLAKALGINNVDITVIHVPNSVFVVSDQSGGASVH